MPQVSGGEGSVLSGKSEPASPPSTLRIVVDLGRDIDGRHRGEVLVTQWPSGNVEADYRWPNSTRVIWEPVQLAHGSVRVERD